MKKVLLILSVSLCCLCSAVYSQDNVKPEFTKSVQIERQGPGHLTIAGVFNHNDDLCMLTSNVNLKVKYFIYVMLTEPFNTGFSVYRFNHKTNRFDRPERIYFPLDKVYYNFETFWYKNGVLNIYTSHKNKRDHKIYYFCTQYDMNTKKSNTTKIFECTTREIATIKVSENGEWAMAVSSDKRSKTNTLIDYMTFGSDLTVKESASKVKLSHIGYSDIQNFEISNKGSLFIGTLYKNKKNNIFEKRTYSNDIFMLKNGAVIEIEPLKTIGYTSIRKLFMSESGVAKIANFYGSKKDNYQGISIADINEDNHQIENISTIPIDTIVSENESKLRSRNKGLDRITQIRSGRDGNYMLLTENYTYREVTTTSHSKNGTTTTTTVYHDYGPGKMFSLDNKNKLLSTSMLEYKMTFGEYADPGTGVNFIPAANNNIYVQVFNTFTKYSMNNASNRIKKPGMLKSTKNAYTGRFSQFYVNKDHAYIFDIKNKKSITMSSFKID